VCVVGVLLYLGCTGCSSSKRINPKQSGEWAYAPYRVEIHPLSRIKIADDSEDKSLIVVHVEFTDQDGYSCRGVGVLSVTLTDLQGNVMGSESVLLQYPDINRQRFDPVTRTYQVHFNNLQKGCNGVLAKAMFTPLGDKSMRSRSYRILNYN